MADLDEVIRAFMRDNPSVTNPALILHGILEAHSELREGKEIDLDIIGLFVQYCEREPPR
jgi:hypothetical protein